MTTLIVDSWGAIQNFKNLFSRSRGFGHLGKCRHDVAQPDDECDSEAVKSHEIADAFLELGGIVFDLVAAAPLRERQRGVETPENKGECPALDPGQDHPVTVGDPCRCVVQGLGPLLHRERGDSAYPRHVLDRDSALFTTD